MRAWRALSHLFPDRKAAMQREHRLTEAYVNVFQGHPSKEDQDLVLINLAQQAGWSMVSPPEASDQTLRHHNGKRYLFAQIWARLSLSDDDRMAIENAARREAVMAEEFAQEGM